MPDALSISSKSERSSKPAQVGGDGGVYAHANVQRMPAYSLGAAPSLSLFGGTVQTKSDSTPAPSAETDIRKEETRTRPEPVQRQTEEEKLPAEQQQQALGNGEEVQAELDAGGGEAGGAAGDAGASGDAGGSHEANAVDAGHAGEAATGVSAASDSSSGGSPVHSTAEQGLYGASRPLPELDRIQESFGDYDVSGVRVQVGGPAERASEDLGARAYTSGSRIAFRREPDLRLAAHEAAHVVQQQHGVQLKGGVGQEGDPYERQADRAADAVVSGGSAEAVLDDEPAGPETGRGGVQKKCECGGTCASCSKQEVKREDESVQMEEEKDESVRMMEDKSELEEGNKPVQMQLEVTTERPRAVEFAGGGGGGGGGIAAGKQEKPLKEKGGEKKKAAEGEAAAEGENKKGEAQASVAEQSAAAASKPEAMTKAADKVTKAATPAERSKREVADKDKKNDKEKKEETKEEKEREEQSKDGAGEAEEKKKPRSRSEVQSDVPVQSKAESAVQFKCDPSEPTPKPADFEEKKEPPPEPPPGKTEDNAKSESPSAEDQSQGCGAQQMAAQVQTAAPAEQAAAPAEQAATAEPAATEAPPEGGAAGAAGAEKGAGSGAAADSGGGGAPGGGGGGSAADTGMESSIGQAEAGRAEAVAAYEASNSSLEQAASGASQLASFNVVFPRVEGGGEVEEKRRSAASDALRGFLSNGSERVSDALSFARDVVPERAGAAAAAAKSQIESAATASAASLSGRVAAARADAHAQAAALAAQINSAHDASVATIEEETNSALDTLDAEHNAAAAEIPTIESDQITALSEVYAEADGKYRKVGKDIGEAAHKRGEFYAQHYDGCHIHRKDSFWDGHLTDRRADARMKAARDVAKSYKESLEKEANKQADESAKGLKCDTEAVHKSAAQMLETLNTQYQSAVEMLLKAQARAIASAGTARDQSLASADQALTGTLAGLDDTERSQLRTISDTAYMQVVAVEQAAHMASSSLQGNILEAANSLSDALRTVAVTLTATPAPELAALQRTLGGGRAKMEVGLASLYEKINGGLSGVESQIADHGNQSSDTVNNACAEAIAQVDQAMAGFSQTMSQIEQSASNSLSQLTDGHVNSVNEMTTSATEGFQQQVEGLKKSYADLNAGVKGRFDEATKGLESGLKDSLKGIDSGKDSIPHYADEAASKEAPAWKSVVKWVLIIAIIVVVALVIGPAVIGAVGAWAGSAFAGAVIGGAIVGAATGAAIQMLNNWETNTTWYEGVGTAALMGAIGGAVGGAGGFLIGRAMDVVGKLAISTISKKVIEIGMNLAFDAVQEIASQLITTGTVDWGEFGKSMVMSLAMAGAGEIPAVKKVQTKFQTKGEAIGGKLPGARVPKPEVHAGGPHGESGAKPHPEGGPETAAPKKAATEPEAAAPKAAAEPEAAAPKGAAESEGAAPKAGAEPETGAPKTGPEGETPHGKSRSDAEVKAESDARVSEGDPAKAEMGETPRLDADPDAPIKSRTDAELAEATVPTKVGDEDHGITPRREGDEVNLCGCSICDKLKTKVKEMMAEIESIPPAKRTPEQTDLHGKLQELNAKVEAADARLKADEKTKSLVEATGEVSKEFKQLGEQHTSLGKGMDDPKAVTGDAGAGPPVKPGETPEVKPGETPAAPKPGETPAAPKPAEAEKPKTGKGSGDLATDVDTQAKVLKDEGAPLEGPVQKLDGDQMGSDLGLKPDQDAVYVLRDDQGNVLKVGKTKGEGSRLSSYKRAGNELDMGLEMEVHPLKPGVDAEPFEKALRAKMENEGHVMPWDNTDQRLGREGFGTPFERGINVSPPPVSPAEMDALLKKHNGDLRAAGKELGQKLNAKGGEIHRDTVRRYAKRLGLDPKTYRP